jgi:hypothetical protein
VSGVLDPADYDARELRAVADVDGVDGETGVSLPRAEGSDYRPPATDEPSPEQCDRLVAIGGVAPAGSTTTLPLYSPSRKGTASRPRGVSVCMARVAAARFFTLASLLRP